jgi:hypothetical protein
MRVDDGQPLTIGMVSGGTLGTRPWRDAVRAVARRLKDLPASFETPLAINVSFQIPGEVIKPDFTGIRTGTFSRRDALLMIQVALPDSIDEDRELYVVARLRDAIDVAERFAIMEALPDTDLTDLRQLVAAL